MDERIHKVTANDTGYCVCGLIRTREHTSRSWVPVNCTECLKFKPKWADKLIEAHRLHPNPHKAKAKPSL